MAKKYIYLLLMSALVFLALSSCSLIDDRVYMDDPGSISEITLTVDIPDGLTPTRGEGDWAASSAEKAVSHVDWLVYGSDGNLVQNVRTSDPTVTIPLDRGNYKVAAVVNYPAEIPSAAVSSVSNYRTLLNVDYAASAGASSPVLVMRSDVIDASLASDLSLTVPVKRVAVRVAILGDVRFTDEYKAKFPSSADQAVRRIFLVNVPSKVGVYDGTMFGGAYVNDAYMNFPSGSHTWYSSSFSPGVSKVHYAHPNSAAEAATPDGEDHVTKLVVETSRGFYPIGLPDIVSNQAVFVSEVVIGGEGLDTPNGYFSDLDITFRLIVLDWDEVPNDKAERLPVWTSEFSAPGLEMGTQSGSVTLHVTSEAVSLLGDIGLEFVPEVSYDGGETWTSTIPSWITVTPRKGMGIPGETVDMTVSWDLTNDPTIGKAMFRLAQDRTERFVETRVCDVYFAGTSTLSSGSMIVNIIDDSDNVVGTAQVPVSGGSFGTALPALNAGTRYSFEGLPLKTVTCLPDRLREGKGPLDGMFRGCSSMTSVVEWDSRNGTSFNETFRDCSSLTSVPELRTSAGVSFSGMFRGCSSLTSVFKYDTHKATDMSWFLAGCSSLSQIPTFNTGSAINVSHLLDGCSSLRTPLPLLNMERAMDMSYVLAGCSGLTDTPWWDTFSVTNLSHAFDGCSGLVKHERWYAHHVTDASGLYDGCVSITDPGIFIGLSVDVDLSPCVRLNNITYLVKNLEVNPAPGTKVILPSSAEGKFAGELQSLILKGWTYEYK